MPRILLINPNITPAITERILAVARQAASPGVELAGVTGRFGAQYVFTRAAAAIAAHAALDAYAEYREPHDAAIIACQGDPGLAALREMSAKPVVGLTEAAILAACQLGQRFALVSGGERWGPMLREFVAAMGLTSRCAAIRALPQTGAALNSDPEDGPRRLVAACKAAVEEDGAEAVILSGASMAGQAARLQPQVPAPLIDNVVAAVRQAEALIALGATKATAGGYAAPPPVDSKGLSPALAAKLSGG